VRERPAIPAAGYWTPGAGIARCLAGFSAHQIDPAVNGTPVALDDFLPNEIQKSIKERQCT